MIDGIRLNTEIPNLELWQQETGIELRQTIHHATGAIVSNQTGNIETIKYNAEYKGYKIQVKEVAYIHRQIVRYFLDIKGSLHKSYFNGTNYQKFSFGKMQIEIKSLCECLKIDAAKTKILNLEVGVNIPFWTQPNQWLKEHLIRYKTAQFNAYKLANNGIPLGYYCELNQYAVKMYDKGIQNNLIDYLLRIEKKCYKMESIQKFGLNVLADLQNKSKVSKLIALVTDIWNNTIIAEQISNIEQLKTKQRKFYLSCLNPLQWDKWKIENTNIQYQNIKKRYKGIIQKYSTNAGNKINDLIITEWNELLSGKQAEKSDKLNLHKLTIKIKGQNVLNQKNRVCKSCGKDISQQKLNSVFCSAKYVGEERAHQCRNLDSNKRNNLKSKIEKINSKGVLFDIVPYFMIANQTSTNFNKVL